MFTPPIPSPSPTNANAENVFAFVFVYERSRSCTLRRRALSFSPLAARCSDPRGSDTTRIGGVTSANTNSTGAKPISNDESTNRHPHLIPLQVRGCENAFRLTLGLRGCDIVPIRPSSLFPLPPHDSIYDATPLLSYRIHPRLNLPHHRLQLPLAQSLLCRFPRRWPKNTAIDEQAVKVKP